MIELFFSFGIFLLFCAILYYPKKYININSDLFKINKELIKLAESKGFKEFNYNQYWFVNLVSLQRWLVDNHNIFVFTAVDCTTYPKFIFEIKQFVGNPKDLSISEWDWKKIEPKEFYLYKTVNEALEEGLILALNNI